MWVQLNDALIVSYCLSDYQTGVLWILNTILSLIVIALSNFSQTLCIANCIDLF